jgi:hypothetical protein
LGFSKELFLIKERLSFAFGRMTVAVFLPGALFPKLHPTAPEVAPGISYIIYILF